MLKYAILLTALFLLNVAPSFSQSPKQPPPVLAPSKEIGKAKVFYIERTNQTRAQAFSYIQGTVMDIYEKKKEVIAMTLEFVVKGRKVTKPEFLSLSLTSYSARPVKYASNHKITIIVDGIELLSETGVDRYVNTPFLRSSSESYGIARLPYKDFETMAKSKRIAIQIGETKIDLKDEDVQALKDLKTLIDD